MSCWWRWLGSWREGWSGGSSDGCHGDVETALTVGQTDTQTGVCLPGAGISLFNLSSRVPMDRHQMMMIVAWDMQSQGLELSAALSHGRSGDTFHTGGVCSLRLDVLQGLSSLPRCVTRVQFPEVCLGGYLNYSVCPRALWRGCPACPVLNCLHACC